MNYRLAAIVVCGMAIGALRADEKAPLDPLESTAARLAASTVTVRILPEKASYARRSQAVAAKGQLDASDGVTVCSGVSVGPGRIVTFASNTANQAITNARVRVTLPDGEQSEAHLRVVDNYSGLSLLDIKEQKLPVLEIAGERPKLGSRILTAAAGGIEGPTVSTGIVAGLNRVIGATILPPMIQCDIRTAETSSGAAVVDKNAKLVGIVAVTPGIGETGGWAYAVSAQHVKRLIAARADDKLLILERRPPTLGLTMGPGPKEDSVKVEHVETGGPADKAGIKTGDLVLEAEGLKVRSAYQVVGMVLNRQAGEKFNFLLEQGDQRKSVDVTLGGVSAHAALSNATAGQAEQPAYGGQHLSLIPRGENTYEVINNRVNINSGGAASNSANALEQQAAANAPAQQRAARTELGQLRSQVMTLENTVKELQDQLQRQNGARPAASLPAAAAATSAKSAGPIRLKKPAAPASEAAEDLDSKRQAK